MNEETMPTESTKPADDELKPNAEEQASAPSEEQALWDEMIAADEPDAGKQQVNGEEVSHEISEPVTESKGDVNNDAPSEKDEPSGDVAKGTEKPAASTAKDDIWASAPPELRAAHEAEIAAAKKAANDARANAGRMRKQYEELQKASAAREADKPGSKKVGDILDEGLAEYPEMAKPVKDALAPIEKQLERLDQFEAAETAGKTEQVNEHIRSQQQILEAAHPGWEKEYVQGARAKQFYDWVLDQPRETRETVFVTNKDHIFDADAAIKVFNAFKASLAPASDSPPAKDGQAQELSPIRQAQLEGTRSPKSPGGTPKVSGIPREGDPDAIWNAFPDDDADEKLTGGWKRRRA